ncbi:ATP:cob(I)alamin adenosyltransferase [mine drainage metagenome]|uniref:ATP:cob(I)alamin adenosyltransferase n=2 Tax=mine drainage metagenome TaxID=410659 RepID=T1BTY3_9ZZZZ
MVMGHRLSRIYTRTGDDGTTGLGNGQRVAKTDPCVEAYGTIDELNSVLGWVRAQAIPPGIDQVLKGIQHALFDLGGEIATPGLPPLIRASMVRDLEETIDRFNAGLPALAEFILPGGGPGSAALHLARTVCRRAERALCHLGKSCPPDALRYLNRLSDLLFVMARVALKAEGGAEELWAHTRGTPPRPP